MKHLFLLLFLLQNISVFSQAEDSHIVQLESKYAKPLLTGVFDKFYIAQITDNRFNKENIGNIINGNRETIIPAQFESSNFEDYLTHFLRSFSPDTLKKVSVFAVVNSFSITEVLERTSKLGYVFLDIDFYKKDSLNQLIPYGHYHGSYAEPSGAGNVTKRFPVFIYKILKNALSTVGQKTKTNSITNTAYIDTSYVPQKGLYSNLLDYKYNTPLQTQQKYSIKYSNSQEITFIAQSDSLLTNFFGYSDGKDFYLSEINQPTFKIKMKKVTIKGRYLFLKKEPNDNHNNESHLPYMGGGFIGGLIVASIDLAINEAEKKKATTILSSNCAVIDIQTGQVLPLGYESVLNVLSKEDEVFKNFQNQPNHQNGILLVKRINLLYYNQFLQSRK